MHFPRPPLPALPLLALSCIRPAPPVPASHAPDPAPSFRLPADTHVRAEHLDLDVDPSRPSFHGTARLDVHLDHPRRSLWLHGRGLRVSHASVTRGAVALEGHWRAREDGLASIELDSPLPAGDATLVVDYDADFASGDVGASHLTRDGDSYAFTQFAAVDARRAFPCFDEPGFKNPFDLTLTVPAGDQAISNTEEERREALPDGRVRAHFRATPPLPAYLVAFLVGPFDVVRAADLPPSSVRPRALPIRGVATRGQGKRLAYALEMAREATLALEDYFAQPFPFEKLDIVAVPDKAGAMENAGAITFEEDALLLDPSKASERDKRSVALFLSHEIAHQWFGDDVTMAWWDDTWLSESFATWMATKVADEASPASNADLHSLAAVDRVMNLDSRASARRLHQPVESMEDIGNVYDDINYEKGSAILGMFERWTGAEAFRAGIRTYVASHHYGSATSSDLLASLSGSSQRDVSRPFETFLEQPGVPFIDVRVECTGRPRVHLAQSRYSPIGLGAAPEARTARWSIPACVRYGSPAGPRETCTLLDSPETDLALEACPTWLEPNADAAGYYRFGLAHEDIANLLHHTDALTPRELVSLASNLRAGMVQGTTTPADGMDAIAALAKDGRSEMLEQVIATFARARDWLSGDPEATRALEAYVSSLLLPAYGRMGWAAPAGAVESAEERESRARVISGLVTVARDPLVRREAKRRGDEYLGLGKQAAMHLDAVAPELAPVVRDVAAEDADAAAFDTMLARLERTDDAMTRGILVEAISHVRSRPLAERARTVALSGTLRGSDPEWLLRTQLRASDQRDDAWQWLRANGDGLLARLAGPARQWLIADAGFSCDAGKLRELDAFLGHVAPQVEGGARVAAGAREAAASCAKQRETLVPALRAFFLAKAKVPAKP